MPVISGGQVTPPGQLIYQSVLFTETAAGATFTGSVTVPGGSFLVDVILHGIALWTAETSANMIVGDAADDNGILDNINLVATDLLAAEGLSAVGVASSSGGKAGADLANSQWNRRYLATARVISGIVTRVGVAGAAGRTLMTVIYTDPAGVGAATVV